MNLTKLMNIQNKEIYCTGCNACAETCPIQCISMIQDQEGFLYPFVDLEKCIHCNRCVDICPQINQVKRESMMYGYACINKNEEVLKNSSSGGAFYEFAKYIIEKGGAVAGAAYVQRNYVKHIIVSRIEDISKLQGSKYVQSDTTNVYGAIQEMLDNQRKVLFSGTPCQIAGLKRYLGKEYLNLYTVGLICHGVPSPVLFKQYILWLEEKLGVQIEKYSFREKEKFDWGLSYSYSYSGKKSIHLGKGDPYYRAFLEGVTYRESCYHCQYASILRNEDITLGDFWGIEKVNPNCANRAGVSLVFVNKKGQQLFELIKDKFMYDEVPIESSIPYQKNLRESTARPDLRDTIYCNLRGMGTRKYNTIRNLIRKKDIIYRLLDHVPVRVIKFMKGCKKIWNQ